MNIQGTPGCRVSGLPWGRVEAGSYSQLRIQVRVAHTRAHKADALHVVEVWCGAEYHAPVTSPREDATFCPLPLGTGVTKENKVKAWRNNVLLTWRDTE